MAEKLPSGGVAGRNTVAINGEMTTGSAVTSANAPAKR
jgi:hypothetical protein